MTNESRCEIRFENTVSQSHRTKIRCVFLSAVSSTRTKRLRVISQQFPALACLLTEVSCLAWHVLISETTMGVPSMPTAHTESTVGHYKTVQRQSCTMRANSQWRRSMFVCHHWKVFARSLMLNLESVSQGIPEKKTLSKQLLRLWKLLFSNFLLHLQNLVLLSGEGVHWSLKESGFNSAVFNSETQSHFRRFQPSFLTRWLQMTTCGVKWQWCH